MGCIQDAISGNYLLTKYGKLPRQEAIELLHNAGVTDFSRLPKKEIVSGREVFSVVLPPDFTFRGKDKSGDEVVIEKGTLKKGVMDKANLGQESGLMLRSIFEQFGEEYTAELINRVSKLGIQVATRYGFSVNIADMDLQEDTVAAIRDIIREGEQQIAEFIREYKEDRLKPLPGRTVEETLEVNILNVLNNLRNKGGNIAIAEDKTTATLMMARSGSRGNVLNIAQMSALVGQQAMRGKRIEKGFSQRTLSYFKMNDLGPAARGFIKNNFTVGLNPAEFFFGAMTGRDSLMDTALRTPKSGYLYRRLSNAMQDLKVEYDLTVRDANKRIIQFKYGEDGLDVARTENGIINVKRIVEERTL
jgi:DNA-directed RNA polymerase subunit A'